MTLVDILNFSRDAAGGGRKHIGSIFRRVKNFLKVAATRRNAMPGRKVTVFGGGNTAFSVAARLAHRGNPICLLEHPDFTESISGFQNYL